MWIHHSKIINNTSAAKIIRMIRQAGAKRIHMRIGSPPITYSCFYGVDTPERSKLLAAQKNVEDIRGYIGCDSLAYLSIDGLRKVLGDSEHKRFCTACFNGKYPEQVHAHISSQPTDEHGPGLRAGV